MKKLSLKTILNEQEAAHDLSLYHVPKFMKWLRAMMNNDPKGSLKKLKHVAEKKMGFDFFDDVDAFAAHHLKEDPQKGYDEILQDYIKNIFISK